MKLLLLAAKIALLVNEANLDPAALSAGLTSSDALERATAARVAVVRTVESVVPQLHDALAAEKTPEAAREEIRALVLLGSDEDVAFAASQLPRFPSSIASDFDVALGRLGAPRAIELALKHDRVPSIPHALWGRSAHVTSTASRFLGAKNRAGFGAVLNAVSGTGVVLDEGVVAAALSTDSNEIVTDTLWYVIRTHAGDPAAIPANVRPLVAPRENAAVEEAFARAVVARMLGGALATRPEWIAWLRTLEGRARVPQTKNVLRFLTLDEQNALKDERLERLPDMPLGVSFPVRVPSFSLPILLPPGLAQRILEGTQCRDRWLGIAGATVDRAGRVQSIRLPPMRTSRGCLRALETMLRLSLADPSSLLAPFTTKDLVVVRPGNIACLDEPLPRQEPAPSPLRVGGDVQAPKVIRRVEPRFPDSVRRSTGPTPLIVILEAQITSTGCVRDVRLLSQTQWPELNGAAIEALSQWKFDPGTLNSHPVDVLFTLTMSFRR